MTKNGYSFSYLFNKNETPILTLLREIENYVLNTQNEKDTSPLSLDNELKYNIYLELINLDRILEYMFITIKKVKQEYNLEIFYIELQYLIAFSIGSDAKHLWSILEIADKNNVHIKIFNDFIFRIFEFLKFERDLLIKLKLDNTVSKYGTSFEDEYKYITLYLEKYYTTDHYFSERMRGI